MPEAEASSAALVVLLGFSLIVELVLLGIVLAALVSVRERLIAVGLALWMGMRAVQVFDLWQFSQSFDMLIDWELVGREAVMTLLLAVGVPATLRLVREGSVWASLGVVAFAASGVGAWAVWAAHRFLQPSGYTRRMSSRRPTKWSLQGSGRSFRYAVATDTILAPRAAPRGWLDRPWSGTAGVARAPRSAVAPDIDRALVTPVGLALLAAAISSLLWVALEPGFSAGGHDIAAMTFFFPATALLGGILAVALVDGFGVTARTAAVAVIVPSSIALILLSAKAEPDTLWVALSAAVLMAGFAADPIIHAWLGAERRATALALGLVSAAGSIGFYLRLDDTVRSSDDPSTMLATLAVAAAGAAAFLGLVVGRPGNGGTGRSEGIAAGVRALIRDPLLLPLMGVVAILNAGITFARSGTISLVNEGAVGDSVLGLETPAAIFGAVLGGWLAFRTRSERGYAGTIASALAIAAVVAALIWLGGASMPGRLELLILAFHAAAAAWYGPLFALFQARANAGVRALAAVIPMLMMVAASRAVAAVAFGPEALSAAAAFGAAATALTVAAALGFFAAGAANRPLPRR